jgi:hypothetical protein
MDASSTIAKSMLTGPLQSPEAKSDKRAWCLPGPCLPQYHCTWEAPSLHRHQAGTSDQHRSPRSVTLPINGVLPGTISRVHTMSPVALLQELPS